MSDLLIAAWFDEDLVTAPAAPGRTTKNTDPRPLGEWAGMSRRMPNMAGDGGIVSRLKETWKPQHKDDTDDASEKAA